MQEKSLYCGITPALREVFIIVTDKGSRLRMQERINGRDFAISASLLQMQEIEKPHHYLLSIPYF